MADDYPDNLTDAQVVEMVLANTSSTHTSASNLADAIQSGEPLDDSDLDTTIFEVLELLSLLVDTVAPRLELDDDTDRTHDDYQHIDDTVLELIDHLDAEVETDHDSGEDTGGATIEHTTD